MFPPSPPPITTTGNKPHDENDDDDDDDNPQLSSSVSSSKEQTKLLAATQQQKQRRRRSSNASTSSIPSYQNPFEQQQQHTIDDDDDNYEQPIVTPLRRQRPFERHISLDMMGDDYSDDSQYFFPTVRLLHKRTLFILTVVLLFIFVIGLGMAFLYGDDLFHFHHGGGVVSDDDKSQEEGIDDTKTTATTTEGICPGWDPITSLKNKSSITTPHGAVATDVPLCSQLSTTTLQNGGNAIDAAITAALCLGVANPASSGLGGGGFFLLSHKDKKNKTNVVVELIDCRETAPSSSTVDMYENDDDDDDDRRRHKRSSTEGGSSVAILGELKCLSLAHSRHGSLPWSDLVDPIIPLAADGVPVSPYLAREIRSEGERIRRNPGAWEVLSTPTGSKKEKKKRRLLREGDLLKQPALARTLQTIRSDPDALYRPPIAAALVDEINNSAGGGNWTIDDISNYDAIIRQPLISNVMGLTIVGTPPPSSGGAVIIGALRFLEGYMKDNRKVPLAMLGEGLSLHRFVEGMKHVFAIRMSLSDPEFDDDNATREAVMDLTMEERGYMEMLREMTSDEGVLKLSKYGGEKWSQLTNNDGGGGGRRRRREEEEEGQERDLRLFQYLNDHGTSHISVVDKDRNAVSFTTTVNLLFGSMLVSPSTGIFFNNEMDDFSSPGKPNAFGLRPSPSNYITPHKRPLSSMSPTLLFYPSPTDPYHRLFLTLGASGGPRIISATLNVLYHRIVMGKTKLFDAVSAPRVHNQLLQGGRSVTLVDDDTLLQRAGERNVTVRLEERKRMALARRGQVLVDSDYLGIVQAVEVDWERGVLVAVSDVRKDGMPWGY